jgi:hypothetical protein
MADLKLKIELVPEPLWGRNLRSDDALGRKRWRTLRKRVLEERGPACAVCGNTEGLHLHEQWSYEERPRTGVAKLVGLEVVCDLCHRVHHFGQTQQLSQEGVLSDAGLAAVKRHFRAVNQGCGVDLDAHYAEALAEWRARSSKVWRVDYGPFAAMVREAIDFPARRRGAQGA